ncbi:PAS domain-containing protein [Candidatus Sumerlaeota bacterium]|nr:PAS domain-containing protein [Candidatus Sumerlaeota bacterium]
MAEANPNEQQNLDPGHSAEQAMEAVARALEGGPGETGEERILRLEQAFEAFTQAAMTFQDYYARLEARIQELNLELERKNRELQAKMEEKEAVRDYLAMLLESISAGVIAMDHLTNCHTVNRAAREIFGLPQELELPRLLGLLIPELSKAEPIDAALREGLSRRRSFELMLKNSGNQLALDVQVIPSNLGGLEPFSGAILVIHDITELKRLEKQAQLTTRLSAMGEVAINVAHEVRNPLGSIELFSSMLRRELPEGDLRDSAGHILTAVRHIDQVVSNILLFARGQEIEAREIDAGQLLDDAMLFLESNIKEKKIRVIRKAPRKPLVVLGDPDLLKQVLTNLVRNAIEAMQPEGRLEVTLSACESDAIIQILDDGCGIPSNLQHKIYDPFFTTRPKGTGLGLAIVHRIVTAHQGRIEYKPRSTGGSEFKVIIPAKK